MNKNIAIKISNVEKSFKLPTESTNSLKRFIVNYFKGIKGYRKQDVLRDISFEVEKGDFFGIVGRNGSGKSTLLKIISQIYVPDKGTVDVNGRLVSFIELGVGFNPELTGKENVYLNGAMLGFSTKEIDQMYQDIVDFSELHDFMNQKLKNYSSGMQVRLAFAVAIQAKSDILVLDEILAVGDEAFQRKCNDYFLEAKKSDKTVILVTHSMDAVRKYCNKAILIDKGEIKIFGTPNDVANQYSLDNVQQSGSATVIEPEDEENEVIVENLEPEIISDIQNVSVKLLTNEIINENNRKVKFSVSYDCINEIDTYLAFSMLDIDRNVWIYNDNSRHQLNKGKGSFYQEYECDLSMINHCNLQLNVSIRNTDDEPIYITDSMQSPMIVVSQDKYDSKRDKISSSGIIKRNGDWINFSKEK